MNENELTNEILNENIKYFNFYVIVPNIISIMLAIISFILGIVFSSIWTAPIFLLYFWVFGELGCVVLYFLLRIILSYPILHIYYLRKIAKKLEGQQVETATQKVSEALPEI